MKQMPDDLNLMSRLLFESIQKLIESANSNELKLDDVFLKQATFPNLLFTSAFVYPGFIKFLKNSTLFEYVYIWILVTFFLTVLSTIVITTVEKRSRKNLLKESQGLYHNLYNKIRSNEIVELESEHYLVRRQIAKNNQTNDDNFLILFNFIEDFSRIINLTLIISFVIIGVIIDVY
jgi:hypothetical protein